MIHRSRLITQILTHTLDWLARLVAFDTRNGTGDEVACVEFLRGVLQGHAPDKLIMETVARSRGKSDSAFVLAQWGTPKVLLNVHIDTVPSGEGWLGDPLAMRREDGKVIGLGTSDIKGAAACILGVLSTAAPKDVAVLFSGDEEHGSEVMPAVIARGHLAGISKAIVCEPTSCTVGRRHRGMLALTAEFTGKGGHSSLADVTARPLLDAAKLASAWGAYNDKFREVGDLAYKGLCLNIGQIESDGSYNVIPTRSKLWASMRPPPGDDVSARRDDLLVIAKDITPHGAIDPIVEFPPFASQDPSAFGAYFGTDEIVDLPYWTEAAMLSAEGMNVVVYGPGDVAQAHKPNEFVTEAQLEKAARCYSRALKGEGAS